MNRDEQPSLRSPRQTLLQNIVSYGAEKPELPAYAGVAGLP